MGTAATASGTFAVTRSKDRVHVDHGWLNTAFSFSFAEYFDPNNLHWGALRVFNDDWIEGGQGFPTHPHRDMEIVTYVLSGELAHKDSMGNQGVVRPGGMQFMSAGTGVRHSEFNARRDERLHLVQMWVMPKTRNTPPAYGQADFTLEDRHNRWLVAVSGEPDVATPIAITQNATLRVARLEGFELTHAFAPKRYAFLYVAQGPVEANGQVLDVGDTVRIYDVPSLTVKGSGDVVFWDLPAAEEA